ncbi:hypothetical protein I4U23_023007 [Adineta vaga]|nr:hypothetical protein I4U23_023007 [Adineta vaga]
MLSSIAFTIVSVTSTSLTVLITLPIIIILSIHLRHERTAAILLPINTYVGILTFSIVFLSTNVNVLKGDLFGMAVLTGDELTKCQFQGFLIYERFGCCYLSFVLQAIYRLTRVLYPKRIFFQSFTFNLICIVLQWIMCFLFLLPSYIWRELFYSFYELDYYCGIRYEKFFDLWYVVLNIYVLPLTYMTIIYIRLMYFIRHTNLQLLQTHQGQRARRDYIITRRILITMSTLALAGLPNVCLAFIAYFNPNVSGDYYMYRIQWMVPGITMLTLSIVLVFITPKLKQIIMKLRCQKNPVVPDLGYR